jgi:hypothetical protein
MNRSKIKTEEAISELVVLIQIGADSFCVFLGRDGKLHWRGPMPGPGGIDLGKNLDKKIGELKQLLNVHTVGPELSKEKLMEVRKLADEKLHTMFSKN